MDGVLCNYEKAFKEKRIPGKVEFPQSQIRFFENLEPIPGAIAAMELLCSWFDVRILTSPSDENPGCYTEKRVWLNEKLGHLHLPMDVSTDKSQFIGEFLIDDNTDTNKQNEFWGELIHFGSEQFPDWLSVGSYLFTQK